MTKQARTIAVVGMAAAIVIVVIVVGRDMMLRGQHTLDCGDGPRRTIDTRDFATQYSGQSLELEATVNDKAKISAKTSPVQLQQLSEVLQSTQEFRKFVVAGYNSCALTKAQYGQYGASFQVLDSVARQINQLAAASNPDQSKNLASLIAEYIELAQSIDSKQAEPKPTQVEQSTTGAGSPVVQGVRGDVTITVDQSTGDPDARKRKKPPVTERTPK